MTARCLTGLDSYRGDLGHTEFALWLLAGAAVFVVADRIVEAIFGGEKAAALRRSGSSWARSWTGFRSP